MVLEIGSTEKDKRMCFGGGKIHKWLRTRSCSKWRVEPGYASSPCCNHTRSLVWVV